MVTKRYLLSSEVPSSISEPDLISRICLLFSDSPACDSAIPQLEVICNQHAEAIRGLLRRKGRNHVFLECLNKAELTMRPQITDSVATKAKVVQFNKVMDKQLRGARSGLIN